MFFVLLVIVIVAILYIKLNRIEKVLDQLEKNVDQPKKTVDSSDSSEKNGFKK